MSFKQTLTALLALLVLTSISAQADELWVRNRPFQGMVITTDSRLKVELSKFAQEFDLEYEDLDDRIIINGFPIGVESIYGVRYVPLREVVDAVGLRMTHHPRLGIIDIQTSAVGTGARGDWEAVGGGSSGSKSSDSSPTRIADPRFSIQLPTQFRFLVDQKFLADSDSPQIQITGLGSKIQFGGLLSNVFIGLMPSGSVDGILRFYLFEDQSKSSKSNDEKARSLLEKTTPRGATIIQQKKTTVAGNDFQVLHYRDLPDEHGKIQEFEVWAHYSSKHSLCFIFVIGALQSDFNRVASQLRPVMKNLRVL